MIEYNAKQILGAPIWSQHDIAPINNKYLDTNNDVSAYAQLCYDDQKFYVRFVKTEPTTLATHTGELGMPCEDSCVEIFFSPVPNDNRYINLEFNANGCVFFGFGTNIKDLFRITTINQNTSALFCPKITKTNSGWELEIAIEYSLIKRIFGQFDINNTEYLLANFYACSDNSNPPHYLSWSKVTATPFTFHDKNSFAKINLKVR